AHLIGVLAGAVGARRTLEVGCGLGYSALWLAYGSTPNGRIETIEEDETHAAIARQLIQEHGYAERITVHGAPYVEALPRLDGPFDVIFYDAFVPGPSDLDQFVRLLRSGGLLITSNLFLGRYIPDLPELSRGAEYRRRLLDDERWLTSFAGLKAVSVRR
ncbi:MAG: O-methyltransferase, partial [Dehalococcoidia bacterium]